MDDRTLASQASSGVSHSPRHGGRTMIAPSLRFDLEAEVSQLFQQLGESKGDSTGRTLVKEPDLRIVLMALRRDGRMDEHRVSGPISIQIVKGRAHVHVAGDVAELAVGQLLALQPDIPHDVSAPEDCAFLLTIGRTTYRDTSEQHADSPA